MLLLFLCLIVSLFHVACDGRLFLEPELDSLSNKNQRLRRLMFRRPTHLPYQPPKKVWPMIYPPSGLPHPQLPRRPLSSISPPYVKFEPTYPKASNKYMSLRGLGNNSQVHRAPSKAHISSRRIEIPPVEAGDSFFNIFARPGEGHNDMFERLWLPGMESSTARKEHISSRQAESLSEEAGDSFSNIFARPGEGYNDIFERMWVPGMESSTARKESSERIKKTDEMEEGNIPRKPETPSKRGTEVVFVEDGRIKRRRRKTKGKEAKRTEEDDAMEIGTSKRETKDEESHQRASKEEGTIKIRKRKTRKVGGSKRSRLKEKFKKKDELGDDLNGLQSREHEDSAASISNSFSQHHESSLRRFISPRIDKKFKKVGDDLNKLQSIEHEDSAASISDSFSRESSLRRYISQWRRGEGRDSSRKP